MTDGVKIDTVRSGSSSVLGRSLNSARHQHFVLDSPSGPNEAITNGEAFLAGISSCGVTLIEKHAHDTGVPLARIDVMLTCDHDEDIQFLVSHSKRAMRVIHQNVALALATKFAFLVSAIFGAAPLWLAVVADTGATVAVTLNGLRLLRAR